MSSEHEALAVAGLSHRYGNHEALVDVSFSVPSGNTFALLGPNGGGKTTLFRIASTLLPTLPGRVRILSHDVSTQAESVRRLIGVVFQSPALDGRLTVQENLTCHGHLHGLFGRRLSSQVHHVLKSMGLVDRAHNLVHTLSGGLQRRTELAKALLPKPRVLILDEPSTGLDPGARRTLWDHLEHLCRSEGTTVVLTSHLMDEAARADRVAVLHQGRLVALGEPRELISKIGGDIIIVTSPDLNALASGIRNRFQQSVKILDSHLRIERSRGHQFITELVEAFPGQINSVTFGKPTLEDVFLHHTGQRWD